MTPEAQRIAIAEACGWEWFHPEGSYSEGQAVGYWQRGIITKASYERSNWIEESQRMFALPDYLTDLNAMHEAEKMIRNAPATWENDARRKFWRMNLEKVTKDLGYTFHATAAQRAEAFLRTLNLWTDDACRAQESE